MTYPVDASSPVAGSAGAADRERVSQNVLKEYEQLLQQLNQIFSGKSNYTDGDSQEVARILKRLLDLQQEEGLTADMNADLKLILLFFIDAGLDPNTKTFLINPDTLKKLSELEFKNGPNTVKFEEVLKLVNAPNRNASATRVLQDSLLDFANWAVNMFESAIAGLNDQLGMADQVLQSLETLQSILNQVKSQLPENYGYPPTNWLDIPKEIQDKIRNHPQFDDKESFGFKWIEVDDPRNPGQKMWSFEGIDNQALFDKTIKWWITDGSDASQKGRQTYLEWTKEYFNNPLNVTPNLSEDAVIRLLQARDVLRQQLEYLKSQGADKTPGGLYDRIEQVLKQIGDDKFPVPAGAPYGKDWTDFLNKVREGDPKAKEIYDSLNNNSDLRKALENLIVESHKNPGLTNAIQNATNSAMHLSSNATNDLNAKQYLLQQIMEILTNIAKSLNQASVSIARAK